MNNNNLENETIEQTNDNTLSKERVFTQDDVNRIVGERLSKEKDKLQNEFALRNAELERNRVTLEAERVLQRKNLPTELLKILPYTDIESFDKSLEIFESIVQEEAQKEVDKRLRGTTPCKSTPCVDNGIRQAFGL